MFCGTFESAYFIMSERKLEHKNSVLRPFENYFWDEVDVLSESETKYLRYLFTRSKAC